MQHCIEMMRESIICRADTTLSSFEWIKPEEGNPSDDSRPRLTVVAKGLRRCVDWRNLRKWNDERSIDAFKPGILTGP